MFHSYHCPRRPRPRVRRAFTLVELLIVILIIGIIVGLIAAVSKYVLASAAGTKTETTQALVLKAIGAYHDERDAYPEDAADDTGRMDGVITELKTVSQAKALLAQFGTGTDAMVDGWDQNMRYYDNQGMMGRPVIVSSGPDRKFGNPEGTAQEQAEAEDNIKSDGS